MYIVDVVVGSAEFLVTRVSERSSHSVTEEIMPNDELV